MKKDVVRSGDGVHELLLFVISIGAGFLGALLGIGGGMIVVPVLTLFLHVDIRYAIAASLISIVATSSGAAASFLKDRMTNLRVAVVLEVGTVGGAITGFLVASLIEARILYLVFGGFLVFSAAMMLRKRDETLATVNHAWSNRLGLASSFPDERGERVAYNVAQVPLALVYMFFAGVLSALLGIGSGVLKVLAMDGAMKLPIKVSSATSNFMIGVTATASAGAYFAQGLVRPEIAAPVAVGIIIGSWLGARQMMRMKARVIRYIFVIVLVVVSIQVILKGLS